MPSRVIFTAGPSLAVCQKRSSLVTVPMSRIGRRWNHSPPGTSFRCCWDWPFVGFSDFLCRDFNVAMWGGFQICNPNPQWINGVLQDPVSRLNVHHLRESWHDNRLFRSQASRTQGLWTNNLMDSPTGMMEVQMANRTCCPGASEHWAVHE